MPRESSFLMLKILANSNEVTSNESAKCRWGKLNAGVVAENWRLSMRSTANLVCSQVYQLERPPYLFAAHLL